MSEKLKEVCPECGTVLVEKKEKKRDVVGTYGSYIIMYCNSCREEVDRRLGR